MERASAHHWDWLSGILLFLLLQISAARLVVTNWAPYLYFAETLAALGIMLGLAIGASRFRAGVSFWLSVAYTIVVVPWQYSGAADDKLGLLDRLEKVGGALLISFNQFMQRKPVTDSLFFVAFVGLVFWILSILAGYYAARKGSILVGAIPAGAIVLVIQVYANYQLNGSLWLGAYLLVALLLVGRSYYLENEKVWSERHVYVNDESWTNVLWGLFVAVSIAVVIAWIFPTSINSVQSAATAWSRMTRGIRDRFSNAVTSLQGPYGAVDSNFYGTSLPLGENAARGDTTVFSVRVLKPPDAFLRFYWRGRVYDTYSDGQWSVSPSAGLDFQPTSDDLPVANIQNHSLAQLQFTVSFPAQTLIYSPSEPVWLDKPASVQFTPVGGGLDDVLSWQSKQTIRNGSAYQVRAQVGDPTAPQLRATDTNYPAWVKSRYLQMPDELRPAIQQLALRVTSGQDNAYDKTVAVTSYLRANLQYSATVPPAPNGRDPIEWVLFDYKQAFCNYYASSEVLMLRSVGVPARLAVGFDQGQYDNGVYTVRQRDAHAWPEVFFPGYGWVEFEPTSSQPALVRIDSTDSSNANIAGRPVSKPREGDAGPTTPPSTTGAGGQAAIFNWALAERVALIVLSIVAVALALYLAYRSRLIVQVPVWLDRGFAKTGLSTPAWIVSWVRWNRLQPVEQAFAPINWSLRSFGKAPPLHATPGERAAALKELLPLAEVHIQTVASELEVGLFTPGTPDVPRARRAAWQILVQLVRARVTAFLGI